MAEVQPQQTTSAQPTNNTILPAGGKDAAFYLAAVKDDWSKDFAKYLETSKRLKVTQIARPPNPTPLRTERTELKGALNNRFSAAKLSKEEKKEIKRRIHNINVTLFEMADVVKDSKKELAAAKKQAGAWKYRGILLSRLKATSARANEICESRGVSLAELFPEIANFDGMAPDDEATAIDEVESAEVPEEDSEGEEESDDEIEA